ncbi:A/G-specific adenine glycosylase [Buchnera aphidicola]|uniref:Adenine DNA glycosylase n=1 Tax=Buchnera aphidicola subsp. Cinara cedri (strain Cc) TaxID=372461 RepID=Q056Y4_BUCCC|nr:A/G-specific adenine glycosylase [Buchnera aphidicola]ABJ90815.1 A/G-specific adenine glycosylase [Buchnera aphidicola BCc]
MFFSQKILNWYHFNGRKNLPWQKKNIYYIWISEIMLQQTRVQTVIPYFQKFKKKFPTIKKLADSNINKVLYLWSGLGYYQRAHNLHKTAKIIKKKYYGIFPTNINEIIKLPGIGRSTAGAILSFTYNYRYAILDSNIKRVLIRFHLININNFKKNQLENKLWNIIDQYIPLHNARKFNQAMMDLGSLICKNKNPNCFSCPLKNNCNFFKKKIIFFKKKEKKKKIGIFFSIIKYKNSVILIKQKNISIWKGLFYFPLITFKISKKKWEKIKKKNTSKTKKLFFTHCLSHIKLFIIWQIIRVKKKKNYKEKIWMNINSKKKIGIPTPIKKILLQLKKKKKNEKKT